MLAVLLLAGVGCATAPERLPPVVGGVAAGEAAQLLRRWEGEWREFPGLRAAVDVTVIRRGRTQRTAGALVLSPDRLRFEAATPFGLPAVVVTAGPDRVLVFSPVERKAWAARPTREAMTRWMGIPVEPATLIRLLAGYVPATPDGVPVRIAEERGPHMVVEREGVRERIWVTDTGEPARLQLEDGERLTATFERVLGGKLQSLTVEAPARGLEVYLRYVSAEIGAPPPEVFELRLPADVPVEELN